jgi:hypothetical protein
MPPPHLPHTPGADAICPAPSATPRPRRRRRRQALLREVAEANEAQIARKRAQAEEEAAEETRVAEYIRQRDAREQAREGGRGPLLAQRARGLARAWSSDVLSGCLRPRVLLSLRGDHGSGRRAWPAGSGRLSRSLTGGNKTPSCRAHRAGRRGRARAGGGGAGARGGAAEEPAGARGGPPGRGRRDAGTALAGGRGDGAGWGAGVGSALEAWGGPWQARGRQGGRPARCGLTHFCDRQILCLLRRQRTGSGAQRSAPRRSARRVALYHSMHPLVCRGPCSPCAANALPTRCACVCLGAPPASRPGFATQTEHNRHVSPWPMLHRLLACASLPQAAMVRDLAEAREAQIRSRLQLQSEVAQVRGPLRALCDPGSHPGCRTRGAARGLARRRFHGCLWTASARAVGASRASAHRRHLHAICMPKPSRLALPLSGMMLQIERAEFDRVLAVNRQREGELASQASAARRPPALAQSPRPSRRCGWGVHPSPRQPARRPTPAPQPHMTQPHDPPSRTRSLGQFLGPRRPRRSTRCPRRTSGTSRRRRWRPPRRARGRARRSSRTGGGCARRRRARRPGSRRCGGRGAGSAAGLSAWDGGRQARPMGAAE